MRDGVTRVDQRREANQRLAALSDFQQLGQLAKGPGGVALVRRWPWLAVLQFADALPFQ